MGVGAATDRRASGNSQLIREYYACFNERRFSDAAALFADAAVLEQIPLQRRERGGAAYVRFAETWTKAFPDATVKVERLLETSESIYEVELVATGTHLGALDLGGSLVFEPTGAHARLHYRELLEFRASRIVLSCISFDLQAMVQQLVRVDEEDLLVHLARIRKLEDQFRATGNDLTRRRELIERLGIELDAARRVVRPYFGR
jgi:predicted ester cyclase